MESNGKSVMQDGKPVESETAAVWGSRGTTRSTPYFELLHQGTPWAALDFLVSAKSSCGEQSHQNLDPVGGHPGPVAVAKLVSHLAVWGDASRLP